VSVFDGDELGEVELTKEVTIQTEGSIISLMLGLVLGGGAIAVVIISVVKKKLLTQSPTVTK
jgi:hypothetical protein